MVKVELIRTLRTKEGSKPPGAVMEVPREEADRLFKGLAARPVAGGASDGDTPSRQEIREAVRIAFENGDVSQRDGKPKVQAVSDILGVRITGEQRDDAWEALEDEFRND